MHHVPRPCFTYSAWLESWFVALWFQSINWPSLRLFWLVFSPVMWPRAEAFLTFYLKGCFWDFSSSAGCTSTFQLHRRHIEVLFQVKWRYLYREVWLSSAARKKPRCETGGRSILAEASRSLSCSQVVFGEFRISSDVSSQGTHTHTHTHAKYVYTYKHTQTRLCRMCVSSRTDLTWTIECPLFLQLQMTQIYTLALLDLMHCLVTNTSFNGSVHTN